ncbi:MAG: hypothetical protein Q9191_003141 [Dirinaria sp. TL-2023a]
MSVDYSKDLILVTCASGKQGAFLLPFLVPKWKHLRLAVNSESSRDRLEKAYPNAEVVQVNLAEPTECRQLLTGVTALYHIGPPLHPHETEIGYNMIDAAVAQGGAFKHFVFSSVLNTQIRKMLNHDGKRYVEEYLIESGLNYTILNPSNFTEAFPVQQALDTGICSSRWNVDSRSSHTCLYDLGEVSSIVLSERQKHYLAQYQVVSTEPLSRRDQCERASKILGKELKAEALSLDETLGYEANKVVGLPSHPYTVDACRRLHLWYNYHGLLGSPNVMRWILGRDPMSFEEWLLVRLAKLKGEEYDFLKARKTRDS